MKKFILRFTTLAITVVAVTNAILFSSLLEKDYHSLFSHEKNSILAYYRLKAIKDKKKIVIIAGSNGEFSINSRMLKSAFHLPVVNTSTHAGIGVRMQFEMYKEFLHQGDIVIFCPEYGGDKGRLYGGTTLLRILSSHIPFAYKKISVSQWCYLYKYIGIHYNSMRHQQNNEKDFNSPYSRNALNEFGDIEFDRTHCDSIAQYDLSGQMNEEVIDFYKYIHSYAKQNGIKLLFLPPTFMESNYLSNVNQIDSMENCLKSNGIAYQSDPSNYSFPDSLYFDTPYHMTSDGANKRTIMLIKDMKRIIKR